MSNNDNDVVLQDEMTSLKSRADLMGVQYHPSIGLEKLREKVNAAVTAEVKPVEEGKSVSKVAAEAESQEETLVERRFRKKREANTLVRIRVNCMNPAKTEWDGEIFTAGNSLVGSFTKYVPFNSDEGWHVPRIIYNQIIQRMCQVFTTVRDARGNNVRKGKLIKEFAVEVLPNLTPDELGELARRQAMAKSVA